MDSRSAMLARSARIRTNNTQRINRNGSLESLKKHTKVAPPNSYIRMHAHNDTKEQKRLCMQRPLFLKTARVHHKEQKYGLSESTKAR